MNAEVKQEWPVNAQPLPDNARAPQVYAAIARVMGEIGKAGIGKQRKNAQQGYMFRGIDDVYNALSPFMAAAQLCVLPRVLKREVTERPSKGGGVLFCVVLEVEFDLVCALDGSRHTVAVVGEAMDSGDKATNKAMSAAYKYACMQAFCIPTEGDNDADSTTHEPAPAPVSEDVWIALGDAAKAGERELRRVWREQVSETMRTLITTHHAVRWDALKVEAMKRPS